MRTTRSASSSQRSRDRGRVRKPPSSSSIPSPASSGSIQTSSGRGGRPSEAASASTACIVVSWHCRRAQKLPRRRRVVEEDQRLDVVGGTVHRLGQRRRTVREPAQRVRRNRGPTLRRPRPPRRSGVRRPAAPRPSGAPSPGARPGRARSSRGRSAPTPRDQRGRRTARRRASPRSARQGAGRWSAGSAHGERDTGARPGATGLRPAGQAYLLSRAATRGCQRVDPSSRSGAPSVMTPS